MRKPSCAQRLDALVTKPGEKCGLAEKLFPQDQDFEGDPCLAAGDYDFIDVVLRRRVPGIVAEYESDDALLDPYRNRHNLGRHRIQKRIPEHDSMKALPVR